MSSEEFVRKVKEYLERRYKIKYEIWFYGVKDYHGERTEDVHRTPDIERWVTDKDLIWRVDTTDYREGNKCQVEEDVDGAISLCSYRVSALDMGDWRNVEYFRKPDEEPIIPKDATREEWKKFIEDLPDRSTWRKYGRFKHVVADMAYADEVASQASKKWRVKEAHFIPLHPEDWTFFVSTFDGKGLSDEEKLKEMDRHVRANDSAYREYLDRKKEKAFERQYIEEHFKD